MANHTTDLRHGDAAAVLATMRERSVHVCVVTQNGAYGVSCMNLQHVQVPAHKHHKQGFADYEPCNLLRILCTYAEMKDWASHLVHQDGLYGIANQLWSGTYDKAFQDLLVHWPVYKRQTGGKDGDDSPSGRCPCHSVDICIYLVQGQVVVDVSNSARVNVDGPHAKSDFLSYVGTPYSASNQNDKRESKSSFLAIYLAASQIEWHKTYMSPIFFQHTEHVLALLERFLQANRSDIDWNKKSGVAAQPYIVVGEATHRNYHRNVQSSCMTLYDRAWHVSTKPQYVAMARARIAEEAPRGNVTPDAAPDGANVQGSLL